MDIILQDVNFFAKKKFNLGLFHIIVGKCLCHISHTLNLCSGIALFTVESMFVGCQNFPRSWESNFVGGVIKKILINIKKMIILISSWGCKRLSMKATNIGSPRT